MIEPDRSRTTPKTAEAFRARVRLPFASRIPSPLVAAAVRITYAVHELSDPDYDLCSVWASIVILATTFEELMKKL
jgi:hypothetical protein